MSAPQIRPARASSTIRQISCRSVEFCRVAAGFVSCTTLVVVHPDITGKTITRAFVVGDSTREI